MVGLKDGGERAMAEKANLVFIFTDQQRRETLECYGNERLSAPHLNGLAEESLIFENAYVTQPLCTPSRSSIMTGLYPHTNGCTNNNLAMHPQTRSIAEMVSPDYQRAYCGKWHLGNEVFAQHGFEEWISIEDGYFPYYSKDEYLNARSSYQHFLIENGFEPDAEKMGRRYFSRPAAARLPEEFTKARFVGREAARYISEHAQAPFILYVNFLEPHMPCTGPFDHMYPPEALPVGPAFLKKPTPPAPLDLKRRADHCMNRDFEGHDLRTEAGWRQFRAQYWGLVTLVDHAVGDILGAIEDRGIADNTLVVFTSDHGEMLGDHAMLGKDVLYEESVSVPLLMRVPWLNHEARRIPGRISQIDLVPTLLELLNDPLPDSLQGQSRAAVVRGETTLEGNDVFIERNRRGGGEGDSSRRAVISSAGWKLNLDPDDLCELYDLNTDPHELTNLFQHPEHRGRIRDLAECIERWQGRTGDTVPLPHI